MGATDLVLSGFVGILCSLVAGLLLQWRGKALIDALAKRHGKGRRKLKRRAYLLALHLPAGLPADVLFFIMTAATAFTVATSSTALLLVSRAGEAGGSGFVASPWFGVSATIAALVVSWFALRGAALRLTAARARAVFARIRESVLLCASKQQFASYVAQELVVDKAKDGASLMVLAQKAIGEVRLPLIGQAAATLAPEDEAEWPDGFGELLLSYAREASGSEDASN